MTFRTGMDQQEWDRWGLLRGSRGSSMAEAALLFPLILVIVFLFIETGMNLYVSVRDDSLRHQKEIVSSYEGEPSPESVLRAAWLLKKIGNRDENKEISPEKDLQNEKE